MGKSKTFIIGLFGLSLLAAVNVHAAEPSSQNSSFNPKQVKAIEKIVHDYLINNPQVLLEASQKLQQQMQKKQQQTALQAIKQNTQSLFNDPASPSAGNPKGNITLVEFFDYQCGHCKTMGKVIQKLVKANPNLKVVFKELPIFGENSQYAAKAALASMSQDKYYEFHNALLGSDNPLTPSKVLDIAKNIGLDIPRLKRDMENPAIQQQLKNNFKLAQALKLMGTPAFVLRNNTSDQFKFIPGSAPEPQMQKQIDMLNKT